MSSPPPTESAMPVTFPVSPPPAIPVSPPPANNDTTPSSPPATAPLPPPMNSTAPIPSPPPPPPPTPDAPPPTPPPPPTPSDGGGSSPSPSPSSPSNDIPSPPPPLSHRPPLHRPPSFPPLHGRPPPSAPRYLTPTYLTPSPGSPWDVVVPVGITLVVVTAVVAIIAGLVIAFFCRKKKRRHLSQNYGYPPSPPKVESYGRGSTNWQQYYDAQHHRVDHVVHVPPRASPPPASPSQRPYPLSERRTQVSLLSPPLPPPPLPTCTSSGGSGANTPLPPPSPGLALGFNKSTFTYNDLSMATDGFSDANLLGQGGFGYVHRGVLPNGKEVAVKHLKAESAQGEREFQAEVEIISRVHHKHLVYLVGYCVSEGKRMLVYEFVPNNTLAFHLHGRERPVLEWSNRLKIALGSAKGLAYLHEDCHPKIIHRDIKSSNILLDFNFEAKVGDFGLAKFKPDNISHLSTRVMGTWGYLAPEYISSGKLTDKLDVFSFGVMLLELITGRKPADKSHHMKHTLVDWARPLLKHSLEEENYGSLVDPRLQYNYNQDEMSRMVSCAAACVRLSAKRRPRMSQIVRALEGGVSLGDIDDDVTPGGYRLYGSLDDDSSSKQYDSHQHNDDMRRTHKIASDSRKYASSEYSEGTATSEYGLNPSASSSEDEGTQSRRAKWSLEKTNRDSTRGFSGIR